MQRPNDGSRSSAHSAAAAWPEFLQAWAAAALPQVRRRRPTSSRRARWTRACWKRLRLVTSRQACEHRWHARRSEAVACNLGSCGRRRCRRRMRHAIVATTILSRFVSYMFCTFISQYMLDVEFGIEKRRGYICIYICRFCNRGARRIYVFIYVYVYMSRGLHISYLIARW